MDVDDHLAVCSWSLQPESADDLIDKLDACGIRRVQLCLDPLIGDEGGWKATGDRLAAAGVEVVSGMVNAVGEDYSTIDKIRQTGGVVLDGTWPQTRDKFRRAAKFAAELKLPLVTFHAGFVPHDAGDPIFAKVRDRLAEVADVFGEAGASVGLETGQESAVALMDLLAAIGRAEVVVNFDPANMILYGSGDPVEAVRQVGSRIGQVHLKDARRSGAEGEWGDEVPVGEGEVDWPAFFAALDEVGYAGDLVIEREAGEGRVENVRSAAEFVRKL